MRKLMKIFAVLSGMVLAANGAFAQSRVTVYGTANMVSTDNNLWALEVGGKVVTGYDYRHFQSTDGAYFAVEDKNGKWGVCDAAGTFLFQPQFAKTSVSGSLAMLYDEANGTPKIYDCKAKAYVQAQRVEDNFFENEYKFREIKARRDHTVTRVQEMSRPPAVVFEVRNNDNYTRQELLANGKVFVECQEVVAMDTSAPQDGQLGWWLFLVRDNGKMGAFLFQVYEKDGKRVNWSGFTIPYRYASIGIMGRNPKILECKEEISLFSGGETYFDWVGFEMEKDGIAYKRTGREWVCVDKETDTWELQETNN